MVSDIKANATTAATSMKSCTSRSFSSCSSTAKSSSRFRPIDKPVSNSRRNEPSIPSEAPAGSSMTVPAVDQHSDQHPNPERDPKGLIGMLPDGFVRGFGSGDGSFLQATERFLGRFERGRQPGAGFARLLAHVAGSGLDQVLRVAGHGLQVPH